MSRYLDIGEASKRLGVTPRRARQMCVNGELAGATKYGRRWYVRITAHERLGGPEGPVKLSNSAELANVPAGKREQALKRLGIICQLKEFAAAFSGRYSDALDVYASRTPDVSRRTLERWLARYRDQGLIGLVDTRGAGKFVTEIMSLEAFELFKSMYLTPQQLAVKVCWQNLCYVNRSENKGWKIPSLPWMYKYVKEAIPLGVRILHREGLGAYEARCAPYIEIDPESIAPGQVWVGDHSQFNCWIRYRGRWVRPWITAWEDMRSRLIMGWHISAGPNQTTILLGMKRAIERHGPPDSAKIDNGRDYDSQMWTGTTKVKRRKALAAGYIDEQIVAGIYAMMDVGVSFAIPYHPQSKPLERFFDTMDCQFTKTIATYCGKDTERKPEGLVDLLKSDKALREACDLREFMELIDRYIEVYNNTAHTGRGMDGRSPAEVMATRTSRRVLAEGVSELLLRVWSGELTVGKNGVKFKGMWYGQFDAELLVRQGKKVRVAYDPDDLRSVDVCDAATLKLVTTAEQNRLIAYGGAVSDEDLRWAMRQKARAHRIAKDFRDSRLAANMDLTDLTLKAMKEGTKETPQERPQTLRPVKTPFNNQVREHQRRVVLKAVKRAAGAEGTEAVLDLDLSVLARDRRTESVDIDLGQLKPEHEDIDLELFNG